MKNPWTGEDRDRGLHALDGALEAVLERITEGGLAELDVIKRVWPDVVAEPLRERSRPVRWANGVLTVEVSDGGAASGLRLQQQKLRTALDQHLAPGEVTQIRIRVALRRNQSNVI